MKKLKNDFVNRFFKSRYAIYSYPFLRELNYWVKSFTTSSKQDKMVSADRYLKTQKQQDKTDKPLKILFVTAYGVGTHYTKLEPVLIKALAARGHDVKSVICGKAFDSCEFNADCGSCTDSTPFIHRRGITKRSRSKFGTNCVTNVSKHYTEQNIPFESLADKIVQVPEDVAFKKADELLQNTTTLQNLKYRGIAIGEEVFASILRVTFVGSISEALNNHSLVRKFVANAIRSVDYYITYFASEKPDRVCLIHGIYHSHGIPAKVANARDIPVIVIGGGGIRKDTFICCHKETYHHQLVNESNDLWNKQDLSIAQKERVLNYARQKRNNGAAVDYLNYHPNPQADIETIQQELNIHFEDYKRVITLYTNVLWDAQILYSSRLFDDIQQWLNETLAIAFNHPDTLFLVRIHPAEVKTATPSRQPLLDDIDLYNSASKPKNCVFIGPFSDVDSYKLAEISDVNVIFGTKMGLEIGLMKKNLITVGESFSRGKGFGYDPLSKADYFEKLFKDIDNKELNRRYETAIKYANYLYFGRMLDLPSDVDSTSKDGLNTFVTGVETLCPFIQSGALNDKS